MYGCVGLCMATHCYVCLCRLCIAMEGYVGLWMPMYGYVCLFRVMYGYALLCMAM